MIMLTEEEKRFLSYWGAERQKRSKWSFQLTRNLPRGLIFSSPIALFFFIEAPRHRDLISRTDLILIMIAVVLIAAFYAIFRGLTQWDKYESHYIILNMKKDREESGHPDPVP